jgi:hypothetical protein
MPFSYNQDFIDSALTYSAYRQGINDLLSSPAVDEHAEKMRPYIVKNVKLMESYDQTSKVTEALQTALEAAPATNWIVITEGWCGDAAFNIPLIAAIEKRFPQKVNLKFFLRDSNLELIDANLTDGGRSIPKLIILSEDFKELGNWGPRPAELQILIKNWKSEGQSLKEYLPKVHEWYDTDSTQSLQRELLSLVKNYS